MPLSFLFLLTLNPLRWRGFILASQMRLLSPHVFPDLLFRKTCPFFALCRDAEDAVRTAGMPKATGATTTPTSTLMPPSSSPPAPPLDKASPLDPPQQRRADRATNVTGSKDKTANNIRSGLAATSASSSAVSARRPAALSALLRGRSLPWRLGKGGGQGTAKGSQGASVSVTEMVKAAEVGCLTKTRLSRRRRGGDGWRLKGVEYIPRAEPANQS